MSDRESAMHDSDSLAADKSSNYAFTASRQDRNLDSDFPAYHSDTIPSDPAALVLNSDNFEHDIDEGTDFTEELDYEMSDAQSEDDDPNARYEDIGIDRKYFDHEYFLHYHGLPSAHEEPKKEIAASKPRRVRPKPAAEHSDEAANTADDATQKPGKKRKKQAFSFHINEDTWLYIFYTKIALVHKTGKHIQMPSDPNTYKLFNDHFESQILQDDSGNPLPPRQRRSHGTMYGYFARSSPARNIYVKTLEARQGMIDSLENQPGGQLYIPVVTDEDIKRFHETGVIERDDPNDKAANLGLAFSTKEVERNEYRWRLIYYKRRAAAQAAADGIPQEAPAQESAEGSE